MRRHVPDDGREDADGADGHQETGPAAPVVGGRNQSKQELPEDGEEVQDVVPPGGRLLVIVLTWAAGGGATKVSSKEADWTSNLT